MEEVPQHPQNDERFLDWLVKLTVKRGGYRQQLRMPGLRPLQDRLPCKSLRDSYGSCFKSSVKKSHRRVNRLRGQSGDQTSKFSQSLSLLLESWK